MILVALLLGIQTGGASPTDNSVADEIVVLGQRLREWRAETVDDGTRCRMIRSSGDPELDLAACAVLMTCGVPYRERMTEFVRVNPRASRRAVKREMDRANDTLNACFDPGFDAAIAALAQRRVAASAASRP